ncbi:MAG: hypothetical protein CEN89_244 [Candidatus Berkelbacteria bacterium Licking1014_7]|uniref:Uncharacterized protein n=1 Tax=Candidatus Berkelbacteria bacterium Licking1014_7 TaxID=2017147 RepID=A0A554LKE6_9BACT|nr:MAG: hypothetical protein CEN89_244 [Candidatus Berkelbacteria bacterium Licking1014_7]
MENIINKAHRWLRLKSGENFLNSEEYCQTRDVFQTRLDKFRLILEQKNNKPNLIYPLIAVIGEIGNNSFDHNLGQWRDVAGIYFNYNLDKKIIVSADRGQGIYASIKKVAPDVKNDLEALNIAFTKKISGRYPEKRGNGLKFVVSVAKQLGIDVLLMSGTAGARSNENLMFNEEKENIKGVLTIIKF